MLQCGAVRCSVLQCDAACCSVLQRVAACCAKSNVHLLEHDASCKTTCCVAVCCRVLQCVAVCCSVVQCVAECCSVLQGVAVLQCGGIMRGEPRREW